MAEELNSQEQQHLNACKCIVLSLRSKPFMVWCVCVRDINPQNCKCVYVCVCAQF